MVIGEGNERAPVEGDRWTALLEALADPEADRRRILVAVLDSFDLYERRKGMGTALRGDGSGEHPETSKRSPPRF